jgi:hypothetical protein
VEDETGLERARHPLKHNEIPANITSGNVFITLICIRKVQIKTKKVLILSYIKDNPRKSEDCPTMTGVR